MSKKITFESFRYGFLVAAERFCEGLKDKESILAWQELIGTLTFKQASHGMVDINWDTSSGTFGHYQCQLKDFIFYARGDDPASLRKQVEKGYAVTADYVLNYNREKFTKIISDIYSESFDCVKRKDASI
jgi:hypothetical protein